jgi:hypothetical protein
MSYSRACAIYLLPYTAMTTVMTWLECLEIVSTVAFIAACWTVRNYTSQPQPFTLHSLTNKIQQDAHTSSID